MNKKPEIKFIPRSLLKFEGISQSGEMSVQRKSVIEVLRDNACYIIINRTE